MTALEALTFLTGFCLVAVGAAGFACLILGSEADDEWE